MEKEFDTDRSSMLIEIAGEKLYFQTVSRAGTPLIPVFSSASHNPTPLPRSNKRRHRKTIDENREMKQNGAPLLAYAATAHCRCLQAQSPKNA